MEPLKVRETKPHRNPSRPSFRPSRAVVLALCLAPTALWAPALVGQTTNAPAAPIPTAAPAEPAPAPAPAAVAPAVPVPAPPVPAALKEIQAKYEKPLRKVNIEHGLNLRGAQRWYLGALDGLERDRFDSGDLDGAAIVTRERERFNRGQSPTTEERQQMPPQLQTARSHYARALARLSFERRRQDAAVQIMYLRDLDKLLRQLLARRDLETARVIDTELQRVRRSLAAFAADQTLSGMQ